MKFWLLLTFILTLWLLASSDEFLFEKCVTDSECEEVNYTGR